MANEITMVKRQQQDVQRNAMRALMAEEHLIQSMREALSGAVYQLQGPVNLISAAINMQERRNDASSNENLSLLSALKQALKEGEQALKTIQACMPEKLDESFRSLNLNVILRDLLSIMTERLLSLGVVVDWQPAPTLVSITGKEKRLRNMLSQILENALDAMEDHQGERKELHIATRASGNHVEITISDTGPGIADEIRLRVFEPFFTMKKARGKHAGMGLSLVQDVINEHSGTVEINPDYRDGCCIKIRLPIRA